MKTKLPRPNSNPPLRVRAEARLQQRPNGKHAGAGSPRSPVDTQRLLHELQVHQIELEMQNEELRKARDEMEAGMEKYSELYDFAPVGYLTLDPNGNIREANLTATSLLGIPRAPLMKQGLRLLVAPADRPNFDIFLQQVFENPERKECDVQLLVKDKPPVNVRLRANRFESGEACRMAITDITQHKQAEIALRENEQRFRAFVTASSDVMYRMNSDWSEMRQLDGRNFIVDTVKPNRDWLRGYILPDDQPRVMAVVNEAVRTKTIFQMEHQVRRMDGTPGWTLSRAVPLLNAQGEIVEWFGAASDVTERKRNELALHESEERFRVMANAISQLAWIARPDGHIFWYNQRWHDYTGTTPKQMEGWGWQSVHDAVVLPEVLKRWKASIATGEAFDMTFPLRGADGSFRTFLTRGIPLKNEANRVVQWFGTNTDITDQKIAEDKVRVSEIRYRRLFEAAHDGVLLLDPDTCKITDANPFMTKLLGYPRDQLVGKELFEIGLLKDKAASQEMFQKLTEDHEVRYEDLPLESQQGRHQEVEVVANLYQENGHSVIQCNIRDITERKQAETSLRRNEALFAALIDQAPMGVYVVNADFRMAQINPKAFPQFRKIRPLIGRDFGEIVNILWPRRAAASIAALFRHTLRTGEAYQSPEFAERRRDTGKDEVYDFQLQHITLPGGDHGVVCFFNDITERKQAEAALSASEERYRTLFTSIDEGYCVIEMIFDRRRKPVDYRFLEVNPVFGKQTGLVKPVGKRMRELVPDIENHWIESYGNVVLTGKAIRFVNEAKAMGGRWFDAYACPVGGPDSRKVAIIFNDITARRKADDALREARVQLTQYAKMLEKTVAARTVELTATNGRLKKAVVIADKSKQQYMQLFLESQLMQVKLRELTHQIITAQEDERKEISRELHDHVVQILVGINVQLSSLNASATSGARNLSEKIARTQQLVAHSVDVVHRFARELRPAVLDDLGLIPALHAYNKNLAERNHLKIHLTAFGGVEAMDATKRTVLFRVAQEALTNVVRHAQATKVNLTITKQGNSIRMEIKDNGKSFKVKPTLLTKTNKRLGLVGMRERIEMVGGSLLIKSAPGQGTTVCTEIPFTPEKPKK